MSEVVPDQVSALPAFLIAALGVPGAETIRVRIGSDGPVAPSSFRVGTAAAVALGTSAVAAARLHHSRGGPAQEVSIDPVHALTEFRSERHLRVNGGSAPELWDPIAGAYRCGDGRYVRIHTNFPHHRDGILDMLGCTHDRAAVAGAVESWPAAEFEAAASERGLVVAMLRSFEEWDRTDQAASTAVQPLVAIIRRGEASALRLPLASRPLEGVRVLEMTRIIAGPVCGRALAGHGAEVLRVIGRGVPTIDALDMDTGHGKRSAWLDLERAEDCLCLDALLEKADVFLHSYRPGALDRFGFGADALGRRHPGLIQASLSAYGPEGPWAGRRGFDSLVQTATGFNMAEAQAFSLSSPKPLPAQVLDHATGHLLAAGIVAALERRIHEGGGWHVKASLARTGLWLRELGRCYGGVTAPDLAAAQAADFLEEVTTPYGRLARVRPAARLSDTPITFETPSAPYGTHPPTWKVE